MIIDKQTLDSLTAQAQASPRLRMNLDLRNSAADQSQRMLNAIEPGTESGPAEFGGGPVAADAERDRAGDGAAHPSAQDDVGDGGVPAGAFRGILLRRRGADDGGHRHGPGRDAHQHPGGAVAQSGVDGIRHGAAGGQGWAVRAHRAGGCVGNMIVDENG